MTSVAPISRQNGHAGSGEPFGHAERPAAFQFRCFGHRYEAWVENDAHGPCVYVSCEVGVLPYSAENRAGRRKALMLLSRAGTIARSRLMLTDFYRISVVTRAPLDDPDDAVSIVSATAAAALHGHPLVNLIADCLDR